MATIENRIQNMINTLSEALLDANKHIKGNNAAGTRIRKAFQTVAFDAKEGRKQVQEERNARP
jgi:hypothetical protein